MPKFKSDKADELFSTWIRLRDNWTCQRCRKAYTPYYNAQGIPRCPALDCSHFVGRRKENTRFEPLNADTLCYGCHQFFHENPSKHLEWQIKRKGEDVVDKLRLASVTYKKKDRALERIYWRQRLISDYNVKA